MMCRSLNAPLALLFLSTLVLCSAQKSAEEETVVEVAEGAPLRLECALRVEERAEWLVDGRAPGAGLRAAGERAAGAGAVLARLEAPAARLDHAGRYTCSPRSRAVSLRVLPAAAHPKPGAEPTLVLAEIRKPLTLACDVTRAPAQPVVWKKNGTAIEELADVRDRALREEGGANLTLKFFHEDDFGNYTCGVEGVGERAWEVRGVPVPRAPADAAVVEGQKLRLTCKVTGKPYPVLTWMYGNDTLNATDVTDVFGARVALGRSEQGVEGGELTLEAAVRADAGQYWCVAGAHNGTTTVRVKDMYAALWPFLGICLEVFVLCAIILVYEKRRTKPELDDSDTDNHDQKKS